jgi:hypothetical protein
VPWTPQSQMSWTGGSRDITSAKDEEPRAFYCVQSPTPGTSGMHLPGAAVMFGCINRTGVSKREHRDYPPLGPAHLATKTESSSIDNNDDPSNHSVMRISCDIYPRHRAHTPTLFFSTMSET